MSTILQRVHDARSHDELAQAVNEFLNADLANQLGDVLAMHDPNGLRPTANAIEVLMAVISSLDDADEIYTGKGVPGIRSYARHAKMGMNVILENAPVTPR